MDLYNSLKGLGPPQNVANTIKRVQANTNWNEFVTNYPFNGTHLNPHSIKKIVDEYYNIDEETRRKWKQEQHDKEDAERKAKDAERKAKDAKDAKDAEKEKNSYVNLRISKYYGDDHGGGKTKRRMHRKSKKLRKRKSKKNSKK